MVWCACSFPTHDAIFADEKWRVVERVPAQNLPASTCSAFWRGATWRANLAGLENEKFDACGGVFRHRRAPISARCWCATMRCGRRYLAMVLWRFDGTNWTRVEINFARRGTRHHGVGGRCAEFVAGHATRRHLALRFRSEKLAAVLCAMSHSIPTCKISQFFGDALWFSTLEDGLVMRSGQSWRHFDGELSSNAPRQMVSFSQRVVCASWRRAGR